MEEICVGIFISRRQKKNSAGILEQIFKKFLAKTSEIIFCGFLEKSSEHFIFKRFFRGAIKGNYRWTRGRFPSKISPNESSVKCLKQPAKYILKTFYTRICVVIFRVISEEFWKSLRRNVQRHFWRIFLWNF